MYEIEKDAPVTQWDDYHSDSTPILIGASYDL